MMKNRLSNQQNLNNEKTFGKFNKIYKFFKTNNSKILHIPESSKREGKNEKQIFKNFKHYALMSDGIIHHSDPCFCIY